MQNAFAKASGDYNPLHINKVKARRSGSGQTVVHGMHLFLWALEEIIKSDPIFSDKQEYLEFSCKFKKPVFLDEFIDLVAKPSTKDNIYIYALEKDGNQLVRIQLKLSKFFDYDPIPKSLNLFVIGEFFKPLDLDILEIQKTGGNIVFSSLNASYLTNSFPRLVGLLSSPRLSAIGALSSLVGMIVPGQYSLFTGFSLRIKEKEKNDDMKLCFRIADYNTRHNLINIDLAGAGIEAKVEALATQKPLDPPSDKDIQKILNQPIYKAYIVLIIGGSRGIGAIAAKLLAEGGAKVIITYKNGLKEAQLLSQHPNITSVYFDTFSSSVTKFIESLPNIITTLMYFATPKIYFRRTKLYHEDKKNDFMHCYVFVFNEIVTKIMSRENKLINVLYPSSIEVESFDSQNIEYIEAKLEAELICTKIKSKYSGLLIRVPRISKIITDQTAWFSQEQKSNKDILYVKSLIDELYQSNTNIK